jgi:hypothetical protein
MSGVFANLNALFIQAHPGIAFKMQLNGTATAAPALTLGVSAFAPMGAEFSEMELEAYKSFVGGSFDELSTNLQARAFFDTLGGKLSAPNSPPRGTIGCQ